MCGVVREGLGLGGGGGGEGGYSVDGAVWSFSGV